MMLPNRLPLSASVSPWHATLVALHERDAMEFDLTAVHALPRVEAAPTPRLRRSEESRRGIYAQLSSRWRGCCTSNFPRANMPSISSSPTTPAFYRRRARPRIVCTENGARAGSAKRFLACYPGLLPKIRCVPNPKPPSSCCQVLTLGSRGQTPLETTPTPKVMVKELRSLIQTTRPRTETAP